MIADLSQYTRRQRWAIERPETRDARDWMSSNEVFKREVRMVTHDGVPLQLVSVLTVDLDDHPMLHARVGFLQAHSTGTGKGDGDFYLPIRMWSSALEQEALRELNALTALPREVEKFTQGVRPKARPSTIHRFIRLSSLEEDWMKAVQCGGAPPTAIAVDPGDRTRRVASPAEPVE